MSCRKLLPSVVFGIVVSASVIAADDPTGHLILNGGGDKPRVVLEKFVELAGGRDASIVVFPTASAEADTGQYYQDLFEGRHGCTEVSVAEA